MNRTTNYNLINPTMDDDVIATIQNIGTSMQAIDNELSNLENNKASNSALNNLTAYAKLKDTQAELYNSFQNKLATGVAVKIVCQGDSLTYGQDLYSADKRPAMSDLTLDTSITRTETQASTTYPEKLQDSLRKIYGSTMINVINRGYSGDRVDQSITRWNTNPNADLHIIILGTNDQSYYGINTFVDNMNQLIQKILDWNSAVMLVMPPRLGGYSARMEAFRQALENIGQTLGIPVMRIDESLYTYDVTDIFSDANKTLPIDDNTHFNGTGYSIIGAKITSLFLNNNPLSITPVTNGTQIVPSSLELYGYKTNGTRISDQYQPMGAGDTNTYGTGYKLTAGQRMDLSFYIADDNAVLIPVFNNDSGQCKITVDFGVLQPSPLSASYEYQYDKTKIKTSQPLILTFAASERRYGRDVYNYDMTLIDTKYIRLRSKGHYTITIENIGASGTVTFEGLQVFDYKVLECLSGNVIFYESYYGSVLNYRNKPEFRMYGVPYSGSFIKGDRVYNGNPATGQPQGWVCTTTGTACTSPWQSNHAYNVGDIVYNGANVYRYSVAGTSGTVAPTHTSGSVTDGTATLDYLDAHAIFNTFGSIN